MTDERVFWTRCLGVVVLVLLLGVAAAVVLTYSV